MHEPERGPVIMRFLPSVFFRSLDLPTSSGG